MRSSERWCESSSSKVWLGLQHAHGSPLAACGCGFHMVAIVTSRLCCCLVTSHFVQLTRALFCNDSAASVTRPARDPRPDVGKVRMHAPPGSPWPAGAALLHVGTYPPYMPGRSTPLQLRHDQRFTIAALIIKKACELVLLCADPPARATTCACAADIALQICRGAVPWRTRATAHRSTKCLRQAYAREHAAFEFLGRHAPPCTSRGSACLCWPYRGVGVPVQV